METLPKDQAVWNVLFSALFLVIFAVFFWHLTDGLTNTRWIFALETFDIAIISLAAYRIIRLISYDKIFQFARNWFLLKQPDGTYKKGGGGPRRTIAELLECLWCTGLWAGLLAVTLYFSADIGRFLVIVLAVSALGSFLQLMSQAVARVKSS